MPKKSAVTNEEFVKAWTLCSSVDDVARKTGLSAARCSSRATELRKAGLKLRRFKSLSKEDVDVDGLNALIAGLDPELWKKTEEEDEIEDGE